MRLLSKLKFRQPKVFLLALFGFFLPLSLFFNGNTIVMIVGFDLLKKKKFSFDKSMLLVVYFIILSGSFFYSLEQNLALKMIVKSLPFLLLPIGLLTTSSFSKKEINYIGLGLLYGNIITILISLIYGVLVFKKNPLPLKDGFSYFTNYIDIHPSYFSVFILFSIVLLFWANKDNKYFSNVKKGIVFILLIAIQLYLKSRAGLIATTLIFFIYGLINFKKKVTLLVVLIPGIILCSFKNNEFLNRNTSTSVDDRVSIWESAIDVIKNNMLFGVGIGDYQLELDRQYYLNSFDHGINDRLNTHNQFLQTFVTSGLIGFLSLIIIFVVLMHDAVKNKNELILYFVIDIGVLMLFDSVLVRQHGILFFTFFTTILIKYKHK